MGIVREVSRFGQGDRLRSLTSRSLRSGSLRRGRVFGYRSRIVRVTGGIAGTQRLTTLTDEEAHAVRSRSVRDAVRPSYKSTTKSEAHAAVRCGRLCPGRLGKAAVPE